jgi:D-alanine-D-alanine ligase
VVLALHGTFGEDGQVQDILARCGIPFTGASAQVSRIAFNKEKTKEKLRENNIPTPEGQLIHRIEDVTLHLPVFIKPNAQGSSIGACVARTREQLAMAITNALQFDHSVLVERFIQGRELRVGVLDDRVLPIIEIQPLDGFYDYANKYAKASTEYFCPARIPDHITEKIQTYAIAAHRSIGAPVYSRIDFLLENDIQPFCLEINTLPGMTATSILPKAAATVGISFSELCCRIVQLSWTAHMREKVS